MKYIEHKEGEWIKVIGNSHKIACCDCGLVHKLNFKAKKYGIYLQAFRDNRATTQRRRYKNIVVKKKR